MNKKAITIIILLLVVAMSILWYEKETQKSDNFMKKINDPNTLPSDFIPRENLPNNVKLVKEKNETAAHAKSINATHLSIAGYRSNDKDVFTEVSVAKYSDTPTAKNNYNLLTNAFIENFELASELTDYNSKFQKTTGMVLNEIPLEKYTTVVLGNNTGVTINMYVWQVKNYAFIVSGGSATRYKTDENNTYQSIESYNGDISLDMAKLILED